jgi:hypothetical protein
VVDLSAMLKSRADRIVMTPSGNRVTVASSDPGIVELNEQGIYEIRAAAAGASGRAERIAVNLDPAERICRSLIWELVAAVTGRATAAAGRPARPRSQPGMPRSSRASGGICSSPAWSCWRAKRSSRTGVTRERFT